MREIYDVIRLKKAYYRMESLLFVKNNILNQLVTLDEDCQSLIYTIVFSERCFPVKASYTDAFFKILFKAIEDEGFMVIDDLYEVLSDILTKRNVENFPYFQGNFHYKTYFLDIGGALVIPESSFLISQGTTGLHIWEASSFLAEYFLENANNLFKDGDTILELGAGLGLASFALAKVFNHLKIIVSDFEVSILEILKEICYLNNSSSQIKTCFLDWNNPSISFEALSNDVSSGSFTCVDWIVAADVVYDPELISPFLACISFFFKKNSKLRVILALTTRNPETFDLFISQLPNFHLRVSQYVNFSPKAFTFCPFSLDISNVLILRIEQIVPSSS